MNPTRWALALALALPMAACTDPSKDDTTDDTDDTVEVPTGDTFDPPDFLEPDIWLVTAEFAVDPNGQLAARAAGADTADSGDSADTDADTDDTDADTDDTDADTDVPTPVGVPIARGYTIGTNSTEAQIIIIGQDDKNGNGLVDAGEQCTIALVADGPQAEAPWKASFTSLLFAFDFGNLTVDASSCEGLVDPGDFPDISDNLADADWGVGLSTSVDADFLDLLTDPNGVDLDADEIIGGAFAGDVGGLADQSGLAAGSVWSQAYEVDEDFIAVFDDSNDLVPLTRDEMIVDSEIQRGIYVTTLVSDPSLIEALMP